MVRYGHAAGHQLGVHVTGDRAIDTVVDAFAAAASGIPGPIRATTPSTGTS